MADRIAAVVVTYNRKVLLGECLDGLLRQTRPLDAIFILDNASTDGTEDFLKNHGYLRQERIQYIRLRSNTGGAGGFHAGLRCAFEAGYDWFWLMDDDVEPFPNGLEQLLYYRKNSECIHGRRRNPDQSPTEWREAFDPRTVTCSHVADLDFSSSQRYRQMNVGCFEGMLVSRHVIELVGLPDPQFFIVHDDTFFGYLASQITDVLYVNAFTLQRKRAVESVRLPVLNKRICYRLGPNTLYYFSRNRFLIAKLLGNYSLPFIAASLRVLFVSLFRELVLVRSIRSAGAVIRGFWDGARLWARPSASHSNGTTTLQL